MEKAVAFVGAGQMAEALARGFRAKNIIAANKLHAYDISEERRRVFGQMGAKIHVNNDDAVASSDVAILAVKPQFLHDTIKSVSTDSWENKLVVSIAAGITLATIEACLPPSARVVRVMPNTPCLVGESASAISLGAKATPEEDGEVVSMLMSTVGKTFVVQEHYLDAVTGLSGSGPAYIFLMIEAMSDGGVRAGLPRDIATTLAAQTVMGAAKMVLETGKHPGQLKDMVTSPGGTTIAGVYELEKNGMRSAFIDAVCAAANRSKELAKL